MIVQSPVVRIVTVEPETVHTEVVPDAYETVKPEDAVAPRLTLVVETAMFAGCAKVMVCGVVCTCAEATMNVRVTSDAGA